MTAANNDSQARSGKVFMSTGDSDNPVSAARIQSVLASLEVNGMCETKSETFPGGHSFHRPHFEQALNWFVDGGAGGAGKIFRLWPDSFLTAPGCARRKSA